MTPPPDFAIIGAQKSATTFLQRCLQAHPEVFVPDGELATFEDPQYSGFEPSQFKAHFAPGKEAAAAGLKRPNYLHEPDVPGRLARHLPHLRFIVALRDPVDRAISAYFHQMRQSFAPVRNVNVGLRAILRGDWEEEWPRTCQIIDYGCYYDQLSRYLQHFNRERFFLTTYRSIKEAPHATVQSICRFLGVSESPDFSKVLSDKANKGVYSKLRLQLIQLINPFRFEYFYDGQRLWPQENVGPFVRAIIRCVRAVDRHLLQPLVTNERPSLEPKVKSELAAHYRPDSEKLREEFDLDVQHWSVFSK